MVVTSAHPRLEAIATRLQDIAVSEHLMFSLGTMMRRQFLLILVIHIANSFIIPHRRSSRTLAQSYYENDDYYTDTEYWDDDDYTETNGYQAPVIEWESFKTEFGDVYVLLPPPSVKPTAILHFVGGTFFGSAPTLWYKELLEDLAKQSQIAIVASTIPVTVLQSPLQHVNLSRRLQKQFQFAWREVLLDEYGEEIQDVPTCAVGHSLGSRLLVVLATLDPPPQRPLQPPPYKSFVLVSFTNYGAAAGIPGIYQLNRASKRIEREEKQSRAKRRRDDWYEDDYDSFDEEWDELMGDLQSGLREQASRVRNALTPQSKDLEFFPTPDQLWKALDDGKRYKVPSTLVVQFDDDRVDQSAKLASYLKDSSDVKYCRLRGTHLTPISSSGDSEMDQSWFNRLNSSVGKAMWKLISGRKRAQSNEESLRSLRQSLSCYITEVVTK